MIIPFKDKQPRIHPSALVSQTAFVIGDVEVGENSSIWPGAVVRGDLGTIKIGDNSQIEDNCVVHTGSLLAIGNNVHIGHSAVIHCSRIGNNVLIGSGAVLLDDVEIGDFCVIGANSTVTERTKIPPRSFVVGTPARVVSEVTSEHLAKIENGISTYVEMTQEYKRLGL